MAAEDRCVWLYAVIDDVEALPAGELTGVGAGPVRAVWTAGLAAIVSDVDEREFGEAALRRNLEHLDWLERTARAHHAVIEAVGQHCPVVPMRLATVYRSDASVLTMLRDRAADFRNVLSEVSTCSEWGVKAFAVASAEPAPEPDAAGKPGTAYLQRRRAALNAQTDARQEAMAGARAVHAELTRHSVSARLYPPQAPGLAGPDAAPMVLNASYLVPDDRAGEFAAAVNDLTSRHRSMRLGLTGPWPAYSFVGESARSGQAPRQ